MSVVLVVLVSFLLSAFTLWNALELLANSWMWMLRMQFDRMAFNASDYEMCLHVFAGESLVCIVSLAAFVNTWNAVGAFARGVDWEAESPVLGWRAGLLFLVNGAMLVLMNSVT